MKPPRKVKRKSGGHVWEVRYRDGGRHRSKVFDRKADAENFQAEVRRRKQLGTIAHLHAGDDLLADFAVEWWRLHAKPNLEPSTLNHYSQVWDCHVLPGLGRYRLKELTPEVVSEFRAMLADKGIGDATIRKAMFTLQSVMGLAVLHGRVATNSVKAVRKQRQRSRRVRPLAPITVETIRTKLGLRDATLVSVLAYAGLRPGEALGLPWQNVRDRTLLVDRSVSLGREKSTKTNATRTVRLIPALIEDLGVWLRAARPGEDAELVFPRPDGKPWTDDDYNNWRRRNYKPRRKGRGPRGGASLRRAPLVRVAADPRGRFDRRGSAPGRPRPRGVPAHLRPHLRGVRPHRPRARRRGDPSGARGGPRPECTLAVRAHAQGRSPGAEIWRYD
jgi:integrase